MMSVVKLVSMEEGVTLLLVWANEKTEVYMSCRVQSQQRSATENFTCFLENCFLCFSFFCK